MTLKAYVHPNCSTCRRALDWLDGRKIDYDTIDIRENPPSVAELGMMLGHCAHNLRRLFNTSGQLYRQQGIKDKLSTMTEQKTFSLLSGNGMLVKRPFVLGEGIGLVGFHEKEWEAALGKRVH